MADVIRDVVVRIALEQLDERLKAPDVSEALAAIERVQQAVRDTRQEVNDFPFGGGFATPLSQQTPEAIAVEMDDLSPILSGLDRVQQELDELDGRQVDIDLDGAVAELERMDAAAADSRKAIADANGTIVEQNLKAADSFKLAGEGAFTMARGIAFLGASSEDDLRQALQTIAAFQGAFDVFKGGTDVIKGLVEGQRALSAASATAAAAQGGLATANTAVATTGTAATASMAAFLVPVAPIAAGLGAIVLAVKQMDLGEQKALDAGIAWREFNAAQEATRQQFDNQARSLLPVEERLRSLQDEAARLAEAQRPLKELRITSDQFEGLKELRDEANYTILERLSDINRLGDLTSGIFGKTFAARSAEAREELTNREAMLRGAEQDLAVSEQATHELSRRLDVQREIRRDTQERIDLEQKEIENKRRIFEETRRILDAENQRTQGIEARIGSLDVFDRREAFQLREKAASGTDLSRFELGRLESLLGSAAAGFVGLERAELGRDALAARGLDSEAFGDTFRTTEEINETQKAIADATKRQAELAAEQLGSEQEITKALEALQRERQEADRQQLGAIAALADQAREAALEAGRQRRLVEDLVRRNEQG